MPKVSPIKLTRETKEDLIEKLYNAFEKLNGKEEFLSFLDNLLTPTERLVLAKRLEILKQLLIEQPYKIIIDEVKVTAATINKMSNILKGADNNFIEKVESLLKEEEHKRRRRYQISKPSKLLFPRRKSI